MTPETMAPASVSDGHENIVKRFEILRRLLEEGLITQEEYDTRRNVNIGALLPYSSPEPSAGLDRPVPGAEQVVSRLGALRRAFEMRSISAREHAVERTMILDALMPMDPQVRANPPPPPQGLLQAASLVSRLERLREAGLISSDQMARERQAIERNLQLGDTPESVRAVAAPAQQQGDRPRMLVPDSGPERAVAPASEQAQRPRPAGPRQALHLASYRSEIQAERGWTELRERFSDALSGMESHISRVDLGGDRGVFHRLMAGPVPAGRDAAALCESLKNRGQYCEVTFLPN